MGTHLIEKTKIKKTRTMSGSVGPVQRTSDVRARSGTTLQFSDLLLSESVLRGLNDGIARAEQPSPVQLTAIPLARIGVDLIAQAKSGTGKTLVYVITALELLLAADSASTTTPLVLVLTPTRELALQVADVARRVGAYVPSLACVSLVGGQPIAGDAAALGRRCTVAVGTPGRVRQLLCETGALNVSSLRLLVLDEADRLFEPQFVPAVREIVSRLPTARQTLAFSATYTDDAAQRLSAIMRDPQRVTLSGGSPHLIGVRQFRVRVRRRRETAELDARLETLLRWLQKVPFQQCVVFCSSYTRAQHVAQHACDAGWRAASISGGLLQRERERTMNAFRNGALNVLVSTDLTSRGVDVDMINFVVHFDAPASHATYFHRVGRAGRFGTYGASLLFQLEQDDAPVAKLVDDLQTQFHVDLAWLEDNVALPDDFLSGAAVVETTATAATTTAATTTAAAVVNNMAQPPSTTAYIDLDQRNVTTSTTGHAKAKASHSIDYGFDGSEPTSDDTIAMSSQPPSYSPAQHQLTTPSASASATVQVPSATTVRKPPPSIVRVPIGQHCEALWADDDEWYEARVVGIEGDKRVVVFDDFPNDTPSVVSCDDIRARDVPLLFVVARGSDRDSCNAFARTKVSNGGMMCAVDGDNTHARTVRAALKLGRSPVVLIGADLVQTAPLARRAQGRGYHVQVQSFADVDAFTIDDALALDLDDDSNDDENNVQDDDDDDDDDDEEISADKEVEQTKKRARTNPLARFFPPAEIYFYKQLDEPPTS
jgi:superfamily II DNA/RNA helicase